MSQEQIFASLNEMLANQKTKNFLNHLIRSYVPFTKVQKVWDRPKGDFKCVITREDLFSTQDILEGIHTEEFKKNLAKSGQGQLVTVSEPVLADKPSQEWFSDTKKEHITKNPNLKSDLALEISFPSVGISKEFGGYYAIGFISAKLVDIKTGAIVGSASAYNIGMTSGISIDGDEGKPDYPVAVKKAFDTLARSLANQAYAKLYPAQ